MKNHNDEALIKWRRATSKCCINVGIQLSGLKKSKVCWVTKNHNLIKLSRMFNALEGFMMMKKWLIGVQYILGVLFLCMRKELHHSSAACKCF